jgi:SP family general alpha glucoside:H+ symporter-like MFS transporter
MRAEDAEKNMSLWSNLRLYKKAVFWSFAVSLCIVMEGFDLGSESTPSTISGMC